MITSAWRTVAIGFLAACSPFLLFGSANAMNINPKACLDQTAMEDCRGSTDDSCIRYEEVAPAKDKDSCPEYRGVVDHAHHDKDGNYLGRDSDPKFSGSSGDTDDD
jgi:hypothetical protein